MKTSVLSLLCASLIITPLGAVAQEASSSFPAQSTDPVINECTVEPAEDIRVSGSEAGKLVHLSVKEGDLVELNQEIGRIDDREAQMAKKVALYKKKAAYERKENDIDERYSIKAAEVAKQEYKLLQETNRTVPNSVPLVEMERARLDAERADLAIEKSAKDQEMATYDYWVAHAEFEAAEMAIQRRIIDAPFDGQVVELYRHQGEWVIPGDPILRLVRLDVLYVDGRLDIENYDPSQVPGCDVTVEAAVGGGRTVQATGKIVHVSPIVLWEGSYVRQVRAEISNQWHDGDWRIHPGVQAKMTIHLGTGVNVSQRPQVREADNGK